MDKFTLLEYKILQRIVNSDELDKILSKASKRSFREFTAHLWLYMESKVWVYITKVSPASIKVIKTKNGEIIFQKNYETSEFQEAANKFEELIKE